MGLSQSSFCKLDELKSAPDRPDSPDTPDSEVTYDLIITESPPFEPGVPRWNKEDKMNCILDEKAETRDDNKNSIDVFESRCKKVKKFVPNILAKKHLYSKNEITIIDPDTKYSMQCQRRSLKTDDATLTINDVEFGYETETCSSNDLFLRDVSNDSLEIEILKGEKSAWQTFNFFLRNTCGLDAPKITNEFGVEEYDSKITIENDSLDENEQKEQPDIFQFNWNIICDENNNNLDTLVERENSEQVTENFQNFLIENYISVGKSIPEIVELDVNDTRTLDFDFYVCPICEEQLQTSLDFGNHLMFCRNQPFFVCLYCTHRTHFVSELKKHMLTRHLHRSQEKLTECSNCNKVMASRNALIRHLRYCGKERNFRCNACSYRTNMKHNLYKHISKKHLSESQESIQSSKKFKRMCSNERLQYFEDKSSLHANRYLKNAIDGYSLKTHSPVHNDEGKFRKYCPQCLHFLGSSKKMKCCLCKSRVLYQCKKCDESFDKYSTILSHASKCNPIDNSVIIDM